ncbi:uncharacterized protein LOC135821099 isoform X2 [Sycon ciliatum]
MCPGTDGVMYTWMALAGLPTHPHVDEPNRAKKTDLSQGQQMCRRRGYNVIDFGHFTTPKLGVRGCMEALLKEMMGHGYSNPIGVWTSLVYHRKHVIYRHSQNDEKDVKFDTNGTSHHDVICAAQWLHANDSVYAAATPSSRSIVTEPFAEEACLQYGLRLISMAWLEVHGDALVDRWLNTLALENKPTHHPYHVRSVEIDGELVHKTVKFTTEGLLYDDAESNQRAQILCVKSCGSGVLAPNTSCMCNPHTSYGEQCEKACTCLNQGRCDSEGKCSCREGFTGDKCQFSLCESNWVRKNSECQCKEGVFGEHCTEVCHCLNNGRCEQDGTCSCRRGFHGDQCQDNLKTKCLGTNQAVYTWTALAGLPCHPHLGESNCHEKTNLAHARQMCQRRGYDVPEYTAFLSSKLNVRGCMGGLLGRMMVSSYSNPITIWTSYIEQHQHLIYLQNTNGYTQAILDPHGSQHHHVVCEAKWLQVKSATYAMAQPAHQLTVTVDFAEEACQQYGLHLVTEDWVQKHGRRVLPMRWALPLSLEPHTPYHLAPTLVNGQQRHRTVTFEEDHSKPTFAHGPGDGKAAIFCFHYCGGGEIEEDLSCTCDRSVYYDKHCEKPCKCLNQGQCDDNGACSCPEGFTGDYCQKLINETNIVPCNLPTVPMNIPTYTPTITASAETPTDAATTTPAKAPTPTTSARFISYSHPPTATPATTVTHRTPDEESGSTNTGSGDDSPVPTTTATKAHETTSKNTAPTVHALTTSSITHTNTATTASSNTTTTSTETPTDAATTASATTTKSNTVFTKTPTDAATTISAAATTTTPYNTSTRTSSKHPGTTDAATTDAATSDAATTDAATTDAATTEAATTSVRTTAAATTTSAATTDAATTAGATTDAATTDAATTDAASTDAATTDAATTDAATTDAATTDAATTDAATTDAATTDAATTDAATTDAATTDAATTDAATTDAATTDAATTDAATTDAATTDAATTDAATTEAATTEAATTEAATTNATVTEAATTNATGTYSATTKGATTSAATTHAATTDTATIQAETTQAATTNASTTDAATTEAAPTEAATTEAATTNTTTAYASTTKGATTSAATTHAATTDTATIQAETTQAATTSATTTYATTTKKATTSGATTHAATTDTATIQAETTQAATTNASTTEAATTEVATTKAATTDAATSDAATTSAATTAGATTSAATTDAATKPTRPQPPTTKAATTEAATTKAATTEAATTEAATTEAATTEVATTEAATTDAVTTDAATSDAATSSAATTAGATTSAATTDAATKPTRPQPPTTKAATTEAATTEAATTEAATTEAATTEVATTEAATTDAVTTDAANSYTATTSAATTAEATTSAATTAEATTAEATTSAATTDAATKPTRPQPPTTKAATTEAATTEAATTEAATTEAATTEAATTEAATTEAATTEAATTAAATTAAATTDAATTDAATTSAATTAGATTSAATTDAATTDAATKPTRPQPPTTKAATTEAATTEAATTKAATTEAATTEVATTEVATTKAATTDAGTSDAATTSAATTAGATTSAATTDAATKPTRPQPPTTKAATTEAATTEAATTKAATTEAATTEAATTEVATTEVATTEVATTEVATTEVATTEVATTEVATTEVATTEAATTEAATTDAATTDAATTSAATTAGATTSAATTDAATKPTRPQPPSTKAATTEAATTKAATTEAATTEAATTKAVTTNAVTTDAATSDAASTSVATTAGATTSAATTDAATKPTRPQPPTTKAATTEGATTEAATTKAATTEAATTEAATTEAATTEAATTEAATTEAATTEAATTEAATTEAATTEAATTEAATTEAATTEAATTEAATTAAATTAAATTAAATTAAATTDAATPDATTTESPTTKAVTTQAETTNATTTAAVTTEAATTDAATTDAVATEGATTSPATTLAATTEAATTEAATTEAATTEAATTAPACECLNRARCNENATCTCRKGFYGDKCQYYVKEVCNGRDHYRYFYIPLTVICSGGCDKRAGLPYGHSQCLDRGYVLADERAFMNKALDIQGCFDGMLVDMMHHGYSTPVNIWTLGWARHYIYTHSLLGGRASHRPADASKADTVCHAAWRYSRSGPLAVAALIMHHFQRETLPTAEGLCYWYGLHIPTKTFLLKHEAELRPLFARTEMRRFPGPYYATSHAAQPNQPRVQNKVTFDVSTLAPKIEDDSQHPGYSAVLCVKHCGNGIVEDDKDNTCICDWGWTGPTCEEQTAVRKEFNITKNGKKIVTDVEVHACNGWVYFDAEKHAVNNCTRESQHFDYSGPFSMEIYESYPIVRVAVDKLLRVAGTNKLIIYVNGLDGYGQISNHYRTFTYHNKTDRWTNRINLQATRGLVVCTTEVLTSYSDSTHTCDGEQFFVSADNYDYKSALNLCKKQHKVMLTFNSMRALMEGNGCFSLDIVENLKAKGHGDFWISKFGDYNKYEVYEPTQATLLQDKSGEHAVICTRPNMDPCGSDDGFSPCGSHRICRSNLTSYRCHATSATVDVVKPEHGGGLVKYTIGYELAGGEISYTDAKHAFAKCKKGNKDAHSDPFRMEEYTNTPAVFNTVNTLLSRMAASIPVYVRSMDNPSLILQGSDGASGVQQGEFRTFYLARHPTNSLSSPVPRTGVSICTWIVKHQPKRTTVREEYMTTVGGEKRTAEVWFNVTHGWFHSDTKVNAERSCRRTHGFDYAGPFNMGIYESVPRVRKAVDQLLLLGDAAQLTIYVQNNSTRHFRTFTYHKNSHHWTSAVNHAATTGLVVCTTQTHRKFVPTLTHTCGDEEFFISATRHTYDSAHALCRQQKKTMLTFNSMRVLNRTDSCFRNQILKAIERKGADNFWITKVGIYDNQEVYVPSEDTVLYEDDSTGEHAVICTRQDLDSCRSSVLGYEPCKNGQLCRSTTLKTHKCYDTHVSVDVVKRTPGKAPVEYTVAYELDHRNVNYDDADYANSKCRSGPHHAHSDPFRMEEYTKFPSVSNAVNKLFKAIDVGVPVFVHDHKLPGPSHGEFHTFNYGPQSTTNSLTKPTPRAGVVICTSVIRKV